jgi:hypothetical protein
VTNKRNRTQLFDTTSTPGPTLLHRVTRRVMGRAELEALQFPGLYTIEHVYTPAQAAEREAERQARQAAWRAAERGEQPAA